MNRPVQRTLDDRAVGGQEPRFEFIAVRRGKGRDVEREGAGVGAERAAEIWSGYSS